MNRLKIFFFACCVFFSLPVTQASEFEVHENSKWLFLERVNTTVPEIVTVLSKLPAEALRLEYPNLVRIEWGYKSLPNGMPDESERITAQQLYKNLDAIFGNQGIWAMSRTGDGGRTMYYYVKNPHVHDSAIKQYFDSLPPISVRISTRYEPSWISIQKTLNQVNDKLIVIDEKSSKYVPAWK